MWLDGDQDFTTFPSFLLLAWMVEEEVVTFRTKRKRSHDKKMDFEQILIMGPPSICCFKESF
jgi:hypothetical protein